MKFRSRKRRSSAIGSRRDGERRRYDERHDHARYDFESNRTERCLKGYSSPSLCKVELPGLESPIPVRSSVAAQRPQRSRKVLSDLAVKPKATRELTLAGFGAGEGDDFP